MHESTLSMLHEKTGNPKGLIVCADDFGLHEGVDAACLALARKGRLNAISCMSAAPSWRRSDALEALLALPVSLGLHLDFTEHPVDAAMRHPLSRFIARCYLGAVDRAAIAREVHAQLDRFEAVAGRAPDHVDGHQHVHQLPLVREALLDALRARYAGALPWLRSTRAGAAPGTPQVKPRIIAALGAARLAALATHERLRLNARLLGVYGFDADAPTYRRLLTAWLGAARDHDLLMCHPSLPRATPDAASDVIGAAREMEFGILDADDSPLSRHVLRRPTPPVGGSVAPGGL